MRRRYDKNVEGILGSNINLIDYDDEKVRSSIYTMNLLYGFGFLFILTGIFFGMVFFDNRLPTPMKIADEGANPDAFIAERAHHDLKLLTDIGEKITGSDENEVLAVDFLKREIGFIMQQANKNQDIELDIQTVSGAYMISLFSMNLTLINTYQNVQNVVVKVAGSGQSNHSILINSHFDTVPTSPGASDDGIMVVTMLEVLRKISRRNDRSIHNIIFLFNGAEETPLQASHGFINRHEWADDCEVVINLDSAGHGGQAVLFQTGPKQPWLLRYYSKVPHPYGQAAGEEIFQSGAVPSDTDFRIFRDFGGMVGLDFAFFKNGYVYHTKYDQFSNLPIGSIQQVGDNVLFLAKALANAPEIFNLSDVEKMSAVYFDYLGFFNIHYTESTGQIINAFVALISIIVFVKGIKDTIGFSESTRRDILLTLGAAVLGWACALVFAAVTALILDKSKYSMSWYTNTWLLLLLYAAPTIALSSVFFLLLRHKKYSESMQAQLQAHVVRLLWTSIIFIGVIFHYRATYGFAYPVLFNCIAFCFMFMFKLQDKVQIWVCIYMIVMLIPTLLSMEHAIVTTALFIPITGRFGPDKNADLIIGLLVSAFTLLNTSMLVVFINLVKKSQYLLYALLGVFIVGFICAFTPLGFPYRDDPSAPTPQRYWILHTSRKIHSESGDVTANSGYFLLNMDRNSPRMVMDYVPEFSRAQSVKEDCQKYLMCGFPLAHSKMMMIMEESTWIPAGQPVIHEPAVLKLNSKDFVSEKIVRYNFTSTGPDRTVIYLSPKENRKLISISMINAKPESMIRNNRELYYIIQTTGKEAGPMTFTFDIEVPDHKENTHIDIAINGIYVHSDKFVMTPPYKQFLDSFPKWTDLTAWLGTYESWVL